MIHSETKVDPPSCINRAISPISACLSSSLEMTVPLASSSSPLFIMNLDIMFKSRMQFSMLTALCFERVVPSIPVKKSQ